MGLVPFSVNINDERALLLRDEIRSFERTMSLNGLPSWIFFYIAHWAGPIKRPQSMKA